MFSNRKNKILITILITLTIFLLGITVYAQEFELQEKEYSEAYKRWLELDEDERESVIQPFAYTIDINQSDTYEIKNRISTYSKTLESLKTSLPSQYKIPNLVVKDQMQTNQCWAFSLNSAIESTYLKQTGESINLSERHMEYATAKYLLNETETPVENPIGFERQVGKGGNPAIGLIYTTNGTGLVYETDMPFENNEDLIKQSEVLNKERKVKVSDYVYFPTIYKTRIGDSVTYSNGSTTVYSLSQVEQVRQEMKQHIYNNGAIASCTFMGGNGLNYIYPNQTQNTTSYYCNNISSEAPGGDHAITIVGWDDTYSRTNFKPGYQPTTDGAWICLNSWGTEKLPGDGYVYISYEDAYIEINLTGIKKAEKVDDEKIYQHDFYGGVKVYDFYKNLSTAYAANVFERSSNNTEYLTEVSLTSLVEQQVELRIEQNGETIYTKNLGRLKEGYHTIELENPILLTSDTFKIITKNTATSGLVYLTVEENVAGAITKATSKAGESYISPDGINWQDLTTTSNTSINFCIKAFTTSTIPVESITLNKNQTTIGIGQTETLTATVLPTEATNKNVSWKSSNSNIVTVSNTGVIKGIAKGTATITVTTEDGEKTATCTVTVEDAPITITSKTYLIEEAKISKVKPSTTKQQLLNNVETNSKTIKIYENQKEITENTQIIKTGMKLQLSNGDEYQIIVTGDLNGDGQVNIVDLSKMKLHQVKVQLLTGLYLKAGDLNYDSNVNLVDLSRIKSAIVGLIEI